MLRSSKNSLSITWLWIYYLAALYSYLSRCLSIVFPLFVVFSVWYGSLLLSNEKSVRHSAWRPMSTEFIISVFASVIRWVAFISVGVGASQRIPFSVLARNTHKGPAGEISHGTRKKMREGRSDEDSSRDESTQQDSQEMRVWQRGDQLTEVKKATTKTCWPTDAGLTNTRI